MSRPVIHNLREPLQPGLSRRMRQALSASGMTQRELTDATCSSTSIVSSWLSGTRNPNAESLAAFCRATGASADWMLGTRRP